MNGHYAIAIDGPSGAGKSTLARSCAKRFGFIYVDTGAIYRTVGLAAHRSGCSCKEESAVAALLPELRIEMKYNAEGEQRMYLNGEDVSAVIRQPEISVCASDVAALPAVRAFLLEMQRGMAERENVIMDGRDIGTVILPKAEVKIFLTASSKARAERRLAELRSKGIATTFEEVLAGVEYRDAQDSSRAAAPLRQAEDAVRLDTSELSFEESEEAICRIVSERLGI